MDGQLFADDHDESTKDVIYGVTEGAKTSDDIYNEDGSFNFEELKHYSHKLPSESVRAEIYEKVYKEGVKPGRKDIEAGSAVGVKSDGTEYLGPVGTVMTSGHPYATPVVVNAVKSIYASGDQVMYTVHTHPYGTEFLPSSGGRGDTEGDLSSALPGIVLNNEGVAIYHRFRDNTAIVPLSLFSNAKKK